MATGSREPGDEAQMHLGRSWLDDFTTGYSRHIAWDLGTHGLGILGATYRQVEAGIGSVYVGLGELAHRLSS